MTNSLQLVLILLAVAVGVVVLCRILRLPAMLGYLLVGILIALVGTVLITRTDAVAEVAAGAATS